jgi:hypothetical protein
VELRLRDNLDGLDWILPRDPKDLALVAHHMPNPWRKPIPGAREVRLEAGKNLTFAPAMIRVKAETTGDLAAG